MKPEKIVWEVKRDYTCALAAEKKREDNRKLDEYRKIEIIPNFIENAAGSARVKIGGTDVIVGVSMSLGTPYPDSPDKGTLMTSCELVPIADPLFESGPPRPNAVEIARVVDRGIRESGTIDFAKLCITPKEEVWTVILDIHVLDHAGNLFDAAELASTAALWAARMPKYEDGIVIREKTKKKLPVSKKPIECTFVKIGDTIMLDPSLAEQKAMDARLTYATIEKDILCAAQKGGIGAFKQEELESMLDIAFREGKRIRKML